MMLIERQLNVERPVRTGSRRIQVGLHWLIYYDACLFYPQDIPDIPMSPYTSPVSELLSLGECDWQEWSDYSRFEFTEAHIPELLKLSQDWKLFEHDDSEMFWSPIHAWRVLAVLQAEAAVKPMIELLHQHNEQFAVSGFLPSVLGRMGSLVTEQLWAIAKDTGNDEDSRDLALESLRWNASFHSDDREQTVAEFIKLLDDREDDDSFLNTALVGCLIDLQGQESIDAIRAAYDRELVELEVHGDIEDIELELGLRETRSFIPDWRFDDYQKNLLKSALEKYGKMSYPEMEGYLFGIWGSPQQVPPNRWLKAIFGEKPDFESEQEEKNIHRTLFNLYDMIQQSVEMGNDVLPKECHSETPTDDAFPLLQEWSRGFGEANSLLVNFWEEIFQHPSMKDQEESWTACTILLSVWAQPEQLLEKSKEENGPNIEKMLSAVPSVARELASIGSGIKTRWQAILDTPNEPVTVEKIGRNDPCTCGSGKKYKKCCGK